MTQDGVQVTRNSSEGLTDKGNNNTPEVSVKSAGRTNMGYQGAYLSHSYM